jgi:transposase InsO family protein/transposase-like protein
MRYTQAEKMEIIRVVEDSALPVSHTLLELGVPKSNFYRWYGLYDKYGYDGLADLPSQAKRFWNRIPDSERQRVVKTALEMPELSPRELAWHIIDDQGAFISESSVYRILKAHDLIASPNYIVLKAADEFRHKTRRINELWQTDFTYLKVVGWGWYYLSTILDDYSRYIVSWKLAKSMEANDVKETLDLAIEKTGIEKVKIRHRPRLLSDNGPCYISKNLGEYLDEKGMRHTRGKPYHPMTQGKIERYHRTMKNVICLDNHYFPCGLEQEIARFVEYYNNRRVHESLDNLTPADVYRGRGAEILTMRQMVKEQTLRRRRRENLGLKTLKEDLIKPQIVRECVS